MSFILTVPVKQLSLIESSTQAPQKSIIEIKAAAFAENVEAKLTLTNKVGEPLLFSDVFSSITGKNTYADYTMDVLTSTPEASEVVLNTMYALQEESSEIYEIDYTLKEDFVGEAVLTFNVTDSISGNTATETISIRVATLAEALEEYEAQIVKMGEVEVTELETQYAELESKRVLVHASISGLADGEEKTAYLARYFAATDLQYTSYKMLLLNLSANNRLDLSAVKNVGGNYPYQVAFRDKVLVGSATQAIRFYPEGFLKLKSGNGQISDNFPEDIITTLAVGQDKVLLPALNTPEGYTGDFAFLDLYKIEGTWYRLPYEYGTVTVPAPTEEQPDATVEVSTLVKVDTLELSIAEQGAVTNTETETAMLETIERTVVTGELVDAQDAELDLAFKLSVQHPIFSAGVRDSFTLDYLITSSVPFPEGASVIVDQNSLNLGEVNLPAGETQFYLSELGLAGVNKEQLNFRTGTDVLDFVFKGFKPGQVQLSAQAIAAEEGEHKLPTSLYSLGQFTGQVHLLDRKGALQHAVDNTKLEITGDTIETIQEGIVVALKATYPEFHAELDPELKVDTLLTFDKPITPGFEIDIELDGTMVAQRYMPEGYEFTELWLSYLLENVAPTLAEHSGKEVTYTITMRSTDAGLFSLDTKLVAAKDGNFDIPAARTVLASTTTALEVTDKTGLITLVNYASSLLENHVEGTETGNASASDREALFLAIDAQNSVLEDDDATLNDIENARITLQAAVDTFKESVVKITIDKVALQEQINVAQGLVDTVEIGIGVGQVSEEAKQALQAELDEANEKLTTLPDYVSVFDTEDTTQAEVTAAASKLATAIDTFRNAIVTDSQYVNARLTEYEQAAKDFYENLRLKLNI